MSGWLQEHRRRAAVERILDAAADLFVERGVHAVGMNDVARAAGCSRATLYRHVADRRELHLAFVDREARRVAEQVAEQVAGVRDLERRVTEAIVTTLRLVRESPAMSAWFRTGDAGATAELATSSYLVEGLGLALVDDRDAARWLVRVIVSLLTVPGVDANDERALVSRFVAPVVTGARAR